MTVRDVAREAGISPNTLVLIEKNATSAQLDTIGRLAGALKIDPCAFFSDDCFPPPTRERLALLRRCVAENICSIRNSRGLSQRVLEHGADLPDRYVAKIEANAPNLTLAVVEKIASRLSVAVVVLFHPIDLNGHHATQTNA